MERSIHAKFADCHLNSLNGKLTQEGLSVIIYAWVHMNQKRPKRMSVVFKRVNGTCQLQLLILDKFNFSLT